MKAFKFKLPITNGTYYSILLLFIFAFGSCKGVPEKQKDMLLNIDIPSMGKVKTVFNFQFKGSGFEAYSKGEQAQAIIGFWKYGMARIFTDNFKNGSIARISNGRVDSNGEQLSLKGILKSPMGDRYFRGRLKDQNLSAFLLDANKDTIGRIKGHPFKGKLPLRNYPGLTNSVLDSVRKHLFKPQLLDTDEWQNFEEDLKEISNEVVDDLGMLMAFSYLSNDLPFSHLFLIRKSLGNDSHSNKSTNYVELSEESNNTALLKINSFGGSGKEINKAFNKVKEKDYQNLIVDLRKNSGGGIEAGMKFMNYLIDTTVYGGIFLTRNYFNNNDSLPKVKDYRSFPVLKKANYNVLFQGIHNYQGIVLKVKPVSDPYEGRIFILTSNKTASTCEPIVYGLKQYDRAQIVGEKTAGSMLSAEPFQLQNNFTLYLPTATYFTSDGYKIDQNGVEPHHNVSDKKALKYTKEKLFKSSK